MPRKPWTERFWDYVEKSDGCWSWSGAKDSAGYGQLNVGGRRVGAHRLAWIIHHGEIPDGLWVLHKCDNPPCTNPFHLILGTRIDNVRDMERKGRGRQPNGLRHGRYTKPHRNTPGIKNGMAILNDERVLEIRAGLAAGSTHRSLALVFGVSEGTIWKIAHRRTWKHI